MFLLGENKIIINVASTGIASTLLQEGSTYHSTFKLYPPITETSVSRVNNNSEIAQQLIDSSLIIWDECTLATNHSLLAVDNLLQELMNNNLEFGGKTIILGKLN